MPEEVVIDYEPPPTLEKFWNSEAYIRCCIGPVGSGKSSACVVEILRRACEQAPGPDGLRHTRFAVIRNTYRELEDTTRKTFEQWIPPHLGRWYEQDFTFSMSFEDVRCEVLFRSLDKPGDIKKLLSLELTGAYINEVREIPKQVLDMLSTRIGRYPAKKDGGPTWRGIWMDTNPWHAGHWGARFFETVPQSYAQAFRQPSARGPNAENIANLDDGYVGRQCIGKDAEWVRIYVDGEDASSIEGSIFGKQISMLRQRGGVLAFDHDPDEVFTTWDLGIADTLSIWWWRFNKHRGVDFIDWYENHNEALSHYFAVVEAKPYAYRKHFLPHDARARTLQTGRSTVELVLERWPGRVAITPQLDVDQGIEAARWLLEQQTTRFHARCDVVPANKDLSGVQTLADYKFEWDEIKKVFSKVPLHNFASHTGDSFRYVACVVKFGEIITRPPPKAPPVIVGSADHAWNLDQLFEDNEKDRDGRRRI